MADKLIVEFYDGMSDMPVAVILVRDHGEDPIAAATTITAFISCVKEATDSISLHVGDLISRFILWEADISGCTKSSPRLGTYFLPHSASYPYQLVRVRTVDGIVQTDIVPDKYSTDAEMDLASALLAL